jgi:hypothetical protein
MLHRVALAAALTLGLATGAATACAQPHPAARDVVINGETLTADQLARFEATLRRVIRGATVRSGRYWYDRMTGGWGYDGGPLAGFILAGLDVGGPLQPDASHGTAPVWVNGRRLHVLDVMGLTALGVPVVPGRYWVDRWMNFGAEGGPPLGNIAAIARQQATRYGRQGSTNVWCDPGGACGSGNIRTGVSAQTDGQGGAIVSTPSGVVIVGH